jgi:carbamoyltransferase
MYLLGIHNSAHDAAACLFRDYELAAAVSLERVTRKKGAGVCAEQELPLPAIDECLKVAGIGRADVDVVCSTRDHWEFQSYALRGRLRLKQNVFRLLRQKRLPRMTYMMQKLRVNNALDIFDTDSFRARYGFDKAKICFVNHHFAHGIAAYFYSPFNDSLVYTADACGDNVAYSARVVRQSVFKLLFGGDASLRAPFPAHSLGNLYGFFTQALGFLMDRHEGKLTGLSAFGEAKAADEIKRHFRVEENGEISADFPSHDAMRDFAFDVARRLSREDAAASVQSVLEDLVCEAVEKLLRLTGTRCLSVAGGVFANVRLNRALIEKTRAERIFIFPAMGDEGLPVGACLLYLHERDGASAWQRQRHLLEHVYLGRSYDDTFVVASARYPTVVRDSRDNIDKAVDALVAGKVVAIYTGRMEYGPRALGNRSILASPVAREINDSINKRLDRSEFMPFAPAVLEEYAAGVFDLHQGNSYAARFMTITCAVHPSWRKRIAAVVHVDGSARPQIVRESENPLYFRVLSRFHERTGLPVLVNTSFNVHEEPIIDTPDQALRALVEGRVDYILTQDSFYQDSLYSARHSEQRDGMTGRT